MTGCTATMCCGVRPSISFAWAPTATIRPVFWFTATMEGSLMTMPRPFTYTSVLAVPRSMPISFEKRPSILSLYLRSLSMKLIGYSGEVLDKLAVRDKFSASVFARDDLNAALRHRFFGNNETLRDTEKIGVGKFFPRAGVAVVIEDLDIVLFQKFVEAVGFSFYVSVAARYRNEMHRKGRHFERPHNSRFVGEHFDDFCHKAPRANAIGTHDNGLFL